MILKDRLNGAETVFGAWCGLDHPGLIQILGRAGFDFVAIDMQHSFTNFGSLHQMLDGLDKSGSSSMVRVPWNTPDYIMRALDLGAEGVIVPMVDSAVEAKAAASCFRYAPKGVRSWGPIWSNARGRVIEPAEGDKRAICIVMIETSGGLASLDEILALEDVDGIYIGPNDLALSLGLGRVHPSVSQSLRETILDVIKRARAAGKIVGIDCNGAEEAHFWRDNGVSFAIAANDAGLLRAAAESASKAMKS